MTDARKTIRDELVQSLLHNLEKDLSDLRNFSDARIRFIPRQALIDTLSEQLVVRLVDALFQENTRTDASVRDVASYIAPQAGCCHCDKKECTGGRKILATLLMIGKEEVIAELFPSQRSKICDQDLPFGPKRLPRRRTSKSERRESVQSTLYSSIEQTNTEVAEVGEYLLDHLRPSDKALFLDLQWQFMTPYITGLALDETGVEEPDQISLPWQERERTEQTAEGNFSFVQKVKIFPGNHNLPCKADDVFALKTFEETLVPGLKEERYAKELKANHRAPQHDRIVPVLAAFKHRRNCYLIFPWADGGSLLNVWETFSPLHMSIHEDKQPATWCSDSWLLDECIGITKALTATHGFTNDAAPGYSRQIHADIKPENILCFFSDEDSSRSLTLKLADYGEAKGVGNGGKVNDEYMPHTKTYRPPENSSPGLITFKYDIWCLGCVFLDFITWYLDGSNGVEAFRVARENEEDDLHGAKVDEAEIIEDTFFKRVRTSQLPRIRMGWRCNTSSKLSSRTAQSSFLISSNFKVEQRVKDTVLTHMKSLQQHKECTTHLSAFIDYIAQKILVIDPRGRAESIEVMAQLTKLRETMFND